MSENGNPTDWNADLLGVQQRLQDELNHLTAARISLGGLGGRATISDTLVTALRNGRKLDTVRFQIDSGLVVAVLARDGDGKNAITEIGAWTELVAIYDDVTGSGAISDTDEILRRTLPPQVAVMAWLTSAGHRVVVHGANGSRLAYRAALAATGRRGGVLGIAGAAAVLGWRVVADIGRHAAATTQTVALVAAIGALTVASTTAAVRPGPARDGNGPAPIPTVTATLTLPPGGTPAVPPGIAHQTGGAAPAPSPGYPGPSGATPRPVMPPGQTVPRPPGLPVLPAPSRPPSIPVIPVPTIPAPAPVPTTPPRVRRRPPCGIGFRLNPVLQVCIPLH